jgi:hypothetical protein
MKNARNLVSVSLAAFAVSAALIAPNTVFAQDKMDSKMPAKSTKMAGKMDKKMASIYVCKQCKMGFTAAQAKKMGMKDPMGHKMMQVAKLPAGFKMAPADGKMGMMDKKMDKMDKMGDKKM